MLFPVVEIHRVVCSVRVLTYIRSGCVVLACGGLVCFPVTCATVPPCVVIRDVRAIVAHMDPVFFSLWNRIEGIVQDFHDIVLDLSSQLLSVIRGVEVGCSRVYSRQGVDMFLSLFLSMLSLAKMLRISSNLLVMRWSSSSRLYSILCLSSVSSINCAALSSMTLSAYLTLSST